MSDPETSASASGTQGLASPARRLVLRGLGAAIALPWLESVRTVGASARALSQGVAAAGPGPVAVCADGMPMRMGFFFVPNGVHPSAFMPARAADGGWLPSPTLEPLAHLRQHVSVHAGLAHANACALGDGPGDHARSAACFLTGVHPVKTAGADIRAGISVDQLAARAVGASGATRFASLELGADGSAHAGDCDSGYSCAYSSNISWRAPDSPAPKETDPRRIFERLFGVGADAETREQRSLRLARRRSVLDLAGQDASALARRVSASDRRRLDDYLESVREIERQVQAAERRSDDVPAGVSAPESPKDHGERLRLIADMMVLAWRLDLTRVTTFMVANEGSNRSFPHLGISDGHHYLTHHGGDAAKVDKVSRIDRWHVEQFAYVVDRLARTDEGGTPLLDRCMLLYGAAIADGNRHNHEDLPVMIAGRGGGTVAPGRLVQHAHGTPMCNLYLSMLDRLGVREQRVGDSTGQLAGLA